MRSPQFFEVHESQWNEYSVGVGSGISCVSVMGFSVIDHVGIVAIEWDEDVTELSKSESAISVLVVSLEY